MEYIFTSEEKQLAYDEQHPVMLDLETLSTRATAAIISIGACKFDPDTNQITDTFHAVIGANRYDVLSEYPFHVDMNTIKWWRSQSSEARAGSFDAVEGTVTLEEALTQFAIWCGDVEVWGNGSDFDNAILSHAYAAMGLQQPWKFWNNRCYRTMKNQFPQTTMPRHGTHHNALHDAISQARHLMLILKRKRLAEQLAA